MRHRQTFLTLCVLLAIAGCDDDAQSVSTRRSTEAVVSEWRSIKDPDNRYYLASELVRDKHLLGLTREDLIKFLGDGNERQMSPTYGKLKFIVGASGVDDEWLCIHIENGKVVRADMRPD